MQVVAWVASLVPGMRAPAPLGRAPLAGILVTAAILPTLMASLATQQSTPDIAKRGQSRWER